MSGAATPNNSPLAWAVVLFLMALAIAVTCARGEGMDDPADPPTDYPTVWITPGRT